MASSAPVPLHVPAAPEAADTEQLQAQQQALLTLGCRVMALPIGRGPLTLGKLGRLGFDTHDFEVSTSISDALRHRGASHQVSWVHRSS